MFALAQAAHDIQLGMLAEMQLIFYILTLMGLPKNLPLFHCAANKEKKGRQVGNEICPFFSMIPWQVIHISNQTCWLFSKRNAKEIDQEAKIERKSNSWSRFRCCFKPFQTMLNSSKDFADVECLIQDMMIKFVWG